jgi:hypothetical protein
MEDDTFAPVFIAIVEQMEVVRLSINALKADPECPWDKRCLAVAATELETAQLWLANAQPE